MKTSFVSAELQKRVISTFPMGPDSVHGPVHWARVLENAFRIQAETGADPRVLELFALFHDSLRQNDQVDPNHGERGALYARKLRQDGMFELEDTAFDLLVEACNEHTSGDTHGNPTIITCWDADRLDLWRCGIRPNPERMCTRTAKRPDVIEWAMQRSGDPPDGIIRNIG